MHGGVSRNRVDQLSELSLESFRVVPHRVFPGKTVGSSLAHEPILARNQYVRNDSWSERGVK